MHRHKMYKLLFFICLIFLVASIAFSSETEKKTVEKKMEQILEQNKYQYQTVSDIPAAQNNDPFLARVFKNVVKAVKNFLLLIIDFIAKFRDKFPVLFFILSIISLAAFSFLFYWLIKKVRFSRTMNTGDLKNKRTKTKHLNYELDFKKARELILAGQYKEAVYYILNGLWLYFHYKKSIEYHISRTNREYLALLKNSDYFETIHGLVIKAEKAVYHEEKVNESECEEIFTTVRQVIQQ